MQVRVIKFPLCKFFKGEVVLNLFNDLFNIQTVVKRQSTFHFGNA